MNSTSATTVIALAAVCAVVLGLTPARVHAQDEPPGASRSDSSSREVALPGALGRDNRSLGRFFAGAALAFASHEAAHLAFDFVFDADPRLEGVNFHGLPFFAITHRADVSRRQRFVIASAGFWVQHAGSEWILTRHPTLRTKPSPLRKGALAFNVLASVAYAGAALARTGPLERDTRGMAEGTGLDERAIGVLVLAPAVFDTVRYFRPEARWPVWASRGVKVGLVLLVLR